ncbi:Proton-dependent oligopeptide transporter family [Corchorus capsularis]|uniref:Proton-dependent oligopeptide transporter family n=1 Tax=Corchorus capsularis TaxID=210143 RepID=A0A1R3J1Z6_COCAP|nr:Proton-dependent oligopeptide transporter family [Corchorus capsularis]
MVLVHGEKDGSNDGPVVDYKGNPVDKSKTGGWLAAGLILGSELSERICVMGISMNLVTYLVGDLHISSAKSATIVTNFMGTLNLLGLLGGFVADAKLGRYLTVAISASITALKRNQPYPSHPSLLNDYENRKVPYTERYKCLDKAAILDDNFAANTNKNTNTNSWIVSTVTQVEEVKMVLKLLPIWSTCILFWTIYSQMTTFTVEQATIMNRKVGSFKIPAGSLSAFLFISILLFTSLNEKVFVPLARRITHTVQGITSLQRIGIGLVLSMAAMVAAAIVEKERREMAVNGNVTISAFWLLFQYFLVGSGEAFAYVGQLEFFIREAPDRMKSMSTGLFLSTISMGFYVSSLLVTIVDSVTKKTWLRNNLNRGKLNNFYWLLAALGFFNFWIFLFFASRHQYKMQMPIQPESPQKELKSFNDEMIDDKEKIAAFQAVGNAEP